MQPDVLLLDEPTAHLDPRTVGWLMEWLENRTVTSIVATHQMPLVPRLGERVVIPSEEHRIIFDSRETGAPPDQELLIAHGVAHG